MQRNEMREVHHRERTVYQRYPHWHEEQEEQFRGQNAPPLLA